MKLLEGKTALVTGAARGIGKGIALKFAAEGANIAFTDLVIDENGEATKAEIEALGVSAMTIVCDVRDREKIFAGVKDAEARFGSVDILVNNAGIAQSTPLYQYTAEEFDKIIDLNVKLIPFIVNPLVSTTGIT